MFPKQMKLAIDSFLSPSAASATIMEFTLPHSKGVFTVPHHEDVTITIQAGAGVAGINIPGEVRQALQAMDADYLRDAIVATLIPYLINNVISSQTAGIREELEQKAEAITKSD